MTKLLLTVRAFFLLQGNPIVFSLLPLIIHRTRYTEFTGPPGGSIRRQYMRRKDWQNACRAEPKRLGKTFNWCKAFSIEDSSILIHLLNPRMPHTEELLLITLMRTFFRINENKKEF